MSDLADATVSPASTQQQPKRINYKAMFRNRYCIYVHLIDWLEENPWIAFEHLSDEQKTFAPPLYTPRYLFIPDVDYLRVHIIQWFIVRKLIDHGPCYIHIVTTPERKGKLVANLEQASVPVKWEVLCTYTDEVWSCSRYVCNVLAMDGGGASKTGSAPLLQLIDLPDSSKGALPHSQTHASCDLILLHAAPDNIRGGHRVFVAPSFWFTTIKDVDEDLTKLVRPI